MPSSESPSAPWSRPLRRVRAVLIISALVPSTPHQRKPLLLLWSAISGCMVTDTASRKTNTKEIIGAAGVREILGRIADAGYSTRTVCIGGINASNLQRIFFQCGAAKKALDGVAVVSAVMAAQDPEAAAKNLLDLVKSPPAFKADLKGEGSDVAEAQSIVALASSVVQQVHDTTPLSHNMTNIVRWLPFLRSPPPVTNRSRWCKTLPQTSPWPWAHRRLWLAMEKKLLTCASSGVPWSSTWAQWTQPG